MNPNFQENNINQDMVKKLKDMVVETVKNYQKSEQFIQRNVVDKPTDSFSIANRQYVNLNGVSSSRPTGSVLGQFYFDTTIGKPVWWNGSAFVDATGTVV